MSTNDYDTCTISRAQLSEICERADVTEGISLDRLREICAAERDGRLVMLPCKAGDTVYPHCFGYVDEGTIESFTVSKYGLSAHFVATDTAEGSYREKDFGKTVFLTREAALAALKGASND